MSITTLQVTDDGAESLAIINANFSELDTGKANDDAVAKLTGNQTIAGVKTFSSSPVVPAPTTDLQVATKKYVDDKESTPGGSDTQIQFNDDGAFAGFGNYDKVAQTLDIELTADTASFFPFMESADTDEWGYVLIQPDYFELNAGITSSSTQAQLYGWAGYFAIDAVGANTLGFRMDASNAGQYEFANGTRWGLLNFSNIASSNKTFTFPNASGNVPVSSATTGGAGSAGVGNQYVELNINGTVYKILHDGTV
jgi:hypothetical protein